MTAQKEKPILTAAQRARQTPIEVPIDPVKRYMLDHKTASLDEAKRAVKKMIASGEIAAPPPKPETSKPSAQTKETPPAQPVETEKPLKAMTPKEQARARQRALVEKATSKGREESPAPTPVPPVPVVKKSEIPVVQKAKPKSDKEEGEVSFNDKKFMDVASAPVSLITLKDAKNRLVEGYQGVLNERLGKVVSVVSDEYKLLPNKHIIDPVIDFLEKKKVSYKLDRLSFVTEQRMRLHLTFPDIKIKDDSKDGILSSMFLHNSYNMTEAFVMVGGAMRLMCSNGMVVGSVIKKIRVIHQANNIKEIATANMEAILKGFYDNQKKIEARIAEMIESKVTVNLLFDIQKAFGDRILAHLFREMGFMEEDTPNAQVTEALKVMKNEQLKKIKLWALYNMMTYYVSHNILQRYRVDYLQKVSKVFEL